MTIVEGTPKCAIQAANEGLCDDFGSDGGEGKSFWPSCKSVYTCEEVSVSSGRWEVSDKVNVNSVESCVSRRK